ncbi:GTP cyclohydrolase I FolE [Anaerotalea alkaliphila]|nr:GTP cyclohydrolase I FolE [Anaerotalea alkaliphila]
MDKEKIIMHVRGILEAIGEDPDREGLRDTPARVAGMYQEVFASIHLSNEEIARQLDVTFVDELELEEMHEDLVLMKDIGFFSYCEHHIALMYNMKATVAYVPKSKVIGLSKVARAVDMVGKRLQLQERIGSDIAHVLSLILDTEDVAVVVEAEHSCMTTRGIRKPGTRTLTTTFRGRFKTDPDLKNKFYALYK